MRLQLLQMKFSQFILIYSNLNFKIQKANYKNQFKVKKMPKI